MELHKGLLSCSSPYQANLQGGMITYKTKVESVQLGDTYIADMDKCHQDKRCLAKCRGDSCNQLYMYPRPFV